ncbi:MAG: DUF5362 family protein, partial [Acidimicrobiia bacterium]
NVMRPLSESAGWMKLIGTLAIVYGVILAITIIGLLIAWLPIWMGVLLNRAAREAQEAAANGDEASAVTATSSLKTIFQVQGIIILVFLVIWGIFLTVGIAAFLANGN